MSPISKLPPNLRKGPFSVNQAEKHGIPKHLLYQLLSEGAIEQLARGIYRVPKTDVSAEDLFQTASLRVGSPSAICLISALSFYHLTDTIPRKTWIMVPLNKRTQYTDIKLLRKRAPKWKIGIETAQGYSITSIERTLVDALIHKPIIGSQIGLDALRNAIRQKKTTLSKVMEMAVKLGVVHRIQAYIEALS